jgi:hypothetical protein
VKVRLLLVLVGCDREGDSGLPAVQALSVDVGASMPTVLVATWLQGAPGPVRVAYSVDDGEWRSTPPRVASVGPQRELLLGLPADHDVEVQVLVGADEVVAAATTGRTGSLDSSFPLPSLITYDPDRASPEGFVLGSLNREDGGWINGTYYVFILDRRGRVVWLRETPDGHWSLYPRPSRDGTHLILDESTYWSDARDASGGLLHRTTIDGASYASVEVPGLHHAWDELPDGTIVWGSVQAMGAERIDARRPDGPIETLWRSDEYFASLGLITYAESNSVQYDEVSDSILISFYTNNTVVEVDATTGEGRRMFGALAGSYAFVPPEAQFVWQHAANFTPDGTLLVSAHPPDGVEEQRAWEYRVNDGDGALELVWAYGEGTGLFARTAGEAFRLPNGNTLINYGASAQIREVTAGGDVVWDVDWDGERLIGHTTLLGDLYDFTGRGPEAPASGPMRHR